MKQCGSLFSPVHTFNSVWNLKWSILVHAYIFPCHDLGTQFTIITILTLLFLLSVAIFLKTLNCTLAAISWQRKSPTIPVNSSRLSLLKLCILALRSLFSLTKLSIVFRWSFSCPSCSFSESKAATVSSMFILESHSWASNTPTLSGPSHTSSHNGADATWTESQIES